MKFGNLLIAGIATGSIYALFAACITVWFRVSNVLNLAIGDFAMVGAMGAAELVEKEHLNDALARRYAHLPNPSLFSEFAYVS